MRHKKAHSLEHQHVSNGCLYFTLETNICARKRTFTVYFQCTQSTITLQVPFVRFNTKKKRKKMKKTTVIGSAKYKFFLLHNGLRSCCIFSLEFFCQFLSGSVKVTVCFKVPNSFTCATHMHRGKQERFPSCICDNKD